MLSEPIDLDAWGTIFCSATLSDLRKHCSKITLHNSDLAKLIIAANYPIPFGHLSVFKHHHPEHLMLTDVDKAAQDILRKSRQMEKERRLFCGHLFYFIEDPYQRTNAWHFFYFDDKDTRKHGGHWKHGSHIHLMNYLTHPNLPLKDLLDKLDSENRPRLGGGLHIRFNRHG